MFADGTERGLTDDDAGGAAPDPPASTRGIVYVVDDEKTVRRYVYRQVRAAGLRAETFPSVQAFLAHDVGAHPACLVLDVRLPGQSGLDLQATRGPRQRAIPIIFVTGRGNVPMSVRAMKEGAIDFLQKPVDAAELLACIDRALAKSREALAADSERGIFERRLATLTPRERQVLDLVVQGLLNKQIAGTLGAAEKTIKVHRGRVTRKMKAESVAQLVRIMQIVGSGPSAPPQQTDRP
jgi:FixJ family two-component response regulator